MSPYALFVAFVLAVCVGLGIGVLLEAIDRWSTRNVDHMVDDGLAAIRTAEIADEIWMCYEAERRLLDWQAHCEAAFQVAMHPTDPFAVTRAEIAALETTEERA